MAEPPNLVHVEDCLWIGEKSIGRANYDFRFQDYFACRHPYQLDAEITAVARMGAANDYKQRYEELLQSNVKLIHTPEEYDRTSNLPNWYPRIREFTPKSIWYERAPTVTEVEDEFEWPIFVKGERQTSEHDRHLSIIETPGQFREVMGYWSRDRILNWQRVVCRQYVKLKPVVADTGHTIPKTFEFRTFWWKSCCVGIGPYWSSENYGLTREQRAGLVSLGEKVVKLMEVTFLVIDMAMREDGTWIVIECNDGQDSGYTGVNPFQMWNNVVGTIRREVCEE